MHAQERRSPSDSSWFLQWRDLVPEEFVSYLIELGAALLRRR